MTLYEQNLQALFQVNAHLASSLFALKTNEKFEVFVDKNDIVNVNILYENEPIYSGIARDEIVERCNVLEAEYMHYPYLYFYGIGNGLLYKLLLQNSDHKKVIVVEKEIELVYIALHFNDFTQEILDERLIIFLQEDIGFGQVAALYYDQLMRLYTKTYHLEIHNSFYENHYMDDIIQVNRLFTKSLEHAVYAAGNDSIDALIGIQHQVANVKKMIHTPSILEFIKKAKNSEVAVIVATGPSLSKQLPLLKDIQEHVTIFSADSSFPILYNAGIKPDVVLSLERVAATAKFFAEVPQDGHKDVIFAITSIAHPDIFKEIKDGTLHVSQRPFGYTRFFELHEYGYAGIGMSVANLAYEYTFHSKFKTIILIGQDLAYAPDGRSHSDGHIYGINDKDEKHGTIEVPAYGGEGSVKTNRIWLLFKNAFETDIYNTKKEGIETINATEGGAHIDGALEMPFTEVIEKYVDKTFIKEQIKLEGPIPLMMEDNLKKIDEKIAYMSEYIKEHQQKVEEVFLAVMQECEKFDELDVYNNLESADSERLIYLMDEIDNIKAYFEDEEFAKIFTDSTQAMIVSLEMDLAKIQVRMIKTEDDKKRKMIDWIYAHRYWLFSLAGTMQATMDAVNMGFEMSIEFEDIESVRVYVDEKEVDTLYLKGSSHVRHEDPLMKNIADIKKICMAYELDEKYQEKAGMLKFYYGNEEKTLKEEVHIPLKNDKNFKNFMFINSLESTIDYTRFAKAIREKDMSLNIGLLPIKDIVENKEIIEAIIKIHDNFPEVRFKFICFKEQEIEMIKRLFSLELDRIDFIAPADIYELYHQIDMFIYDLESLDEKRLYAIRYILNSTKEVEVPQLVIESSKAEEAETKNHINTINFAIIFKLRQDIRVDVYVDDEKIDEIKQTEKPMNNVYDLKQFCIEYTLDDKYVSQIDELKFVYVDEARNIKMPLYLPSRSDEGYNEFVFKNSLEATIEKEKIENLYEKGVIGFLATERNLEDNNFMSYIQELMDKFPDVKIKGFFFDKNRLLNLNNNKINFIFLNNIQKISEEIEIFIWDLKDSLDLKIVNYFIKNSRCIYSIYNFKNPNFGDFKNKTLMDVDKRYYEKEEIIITKPEKFGFTNNEITTCGKSYFKLMYEALLVKEENINYTLDLEQDAMEFLQFKQINLVLEHKKFKESMIRIHKMRNYSC